MPPYLLQLQTDGSATSVSWRLSQTNQLLMVVVMQWLLSCCRCNCVLWRKKMVLQERDVGKLGNLKESRTVGRLPAL